MKIIGNGVDIIENSRIKSAIKNQNFIKKIFSDYEILMQNKRLDKVNFFAKRFAAKEAFLKAIGTGLSSGISFKDITIKNNKKGKPKMIVNKKIKEIIYKKFKIKRFNIFLSLSDEKKYSIAFVIINKN